MEGNQYREGYAVLTEPFCIQDIKKKGKYGRAHNHRQ